MLHSVALLMSLTIIHFQSIISFQSNTILTGVNTFPALPTSVTKAPAQCAGLCCTLLPSTGKHALSKKSTNLFPPMFPQLLANGLSLVSIATTGHASLRQFIEDKNKKLKLK